LLARLDIARGEYNAARLNRLDQFASSLIELSAGQSDE
jgi:hypothetical protein